MLSQVMLLGFWVAEIISRVNLLLISLQNINEKPVILEMLMILKLMTKIQKSVKKVI